MRVQGLAVFFCLTACAGADVTPVWDPGGPSPKFTAVPKREAKTSVEPATNTKSRLDRVDLQPREPGTKSKLPLSGPRRRALESERQTVSAEIKALERREHFDVDRGADRRHARANDTRRLRALKARQRSVLRRLRGE